MNLVNCAFGFFFHIFLLLMLFLRMNILLFFFFPLISICINAAMVFPLRQVLSTVLYVSNFCIFFFFFFSPCCFRGNHDADPLLSKKGGGLNIALVYILCSLLYLLWLNDTQSSMCEILVEVTDNSIEKTFFVKSRYGFIKASCGA